jgi:transposase
MAQRNLSMRKTREILRLKYDARLSHRGISRACRVSPSTVWDCLNRFKEAELTWPLSEELDDSALVQRLYRGEEKANPLDPHRPDWDWVHKELRKKHVTLMLLWQEYKAAHPEGYQYSWFCRHFALFKQMLDVVMRQDHKLGEKGYVDYAGDTLEIVDPQSGEVQKAYLFVGALGASNYTYAEASLKQDVMSWIMAHVRMFDYWGGCPEILVPDNLKTGVLSPNLYEPDINPLYQEMAQHYDVAVIPARVRRPKDKAKVENGVLVAERWILAALRNRTFTSIDELNVAIREKLEELNGRPFQKLEGSRRILFETEEKTILKPLPPRRYQVADRKPARVHIDYHVELDGHYYSVPYTLVRQRVEIRFSPSTVEILHNGKRVASHLRSYQKGKATTLAEHMPEAHRRQAEWTPERLVAWAQKTGPWTAKVVEGIMSQKRHPQQGFRSCLGVMRLADRHGAVRLEVACRRAVQLGAYAYKSIKSILDHHLEEQMLPSSSDQTHFEFIRHENIRGRDYYH